MEELQVCMRWNETDAQSMGNQLREGSTLSTRVETGHQNKGLAMRCSADSSHKQLLTDVNTSSDDLGL